MLASAVVNLIVYVGYWMLSPHNNCQTLRSTTANPLMKTPEGNVYTREYFVKKIQIKQLNQKCKLYSEIKFCTAEFKIHYSNRIELIHTDTNVVNGHKDRYGKREPQRGATPRFAL